MSKRFEQLVNRVAEDRGSSADLLSALLDFQHLLSRINDDHAALEPDDVDRRIEWIRTLPSYPWHREQLASFLDDAASIASHICMLAFCPR